MKYPSTARTKAAWFKRHKHEIYTRRRRYREAHLDKIRERERLEYRERAARNLRVRGYKRFLRLAPGLPVRKNVWLMWVSPGAAWRYSSWYRSYRDWINWVGRKPGIPTLSEGVIFDVV